MVGKKYTKRWWKCHWRIDSELRHSLVAPFMEEGIMNNKQQRHEHLLDFIAMHMSGNTKLMSYTTFNSFMNGNHKAKNGHPKKQHNILQMIISMKLPAKNEVASTSEESATNSVPV